MKKIRRYCFIDRIGDPHIIRLKDFVIFKDAYLTEYDRFLIDENTGEQYEALFYTTFEENVLENPDLMPWVNGWRMKKKTAIKFDKTPPANAKLFIKDRDYKEAITKTEVI